MLEKSFGCLMQPQIFSGFFFFFLNENAHRFAKTIFFPFRLLTIVLVFFKSILNIDPLLGFCEIEISIQMHLPPKSDHLISKRTLNVPYKRVSLYIPLPKYKVQRNAPRLYKCHGLICLRQDCHIKGERSPRRCLFDVLSPA